LTTLRRLAGGEGAIFSVYCRSTAGAAFAIAPAHAENRVALVIGNSTYMNVSQLRNPEGNARLIADTLRSLGFSRVYDGPLINLDKAGFDCTDFPWKKSTK
jgi:hypothetical protein